jgi:hypothetical protein
VTFCGIPIPNRWGHLLARALGCPDAYRMFSGTWNDWEDET